MKKTIETRGEILEGVSLHHAPINEFGVVFLFAELARKWRLRIDTIRASFPDCIAYQKIRGREKKVRIEFEFKSRSFKTHHHDPRKCDWIVCWEHNWPAVPKHLRVVELRREFGLGFNVWICPISKPYKDAMEQINVRATSAWSLPPHCHPGDLVLYYFTSPDCHIAHLFVAPKGVTDPNGPWGTMGPIRRVCRLKAPIFLKDLERDPVLKTAPFFRGRMQGRPNATEYWPYLYDLIIRRNPTAARPLKRYAPERL
jgi:hypothetical protein